MKEVGLDAWNVGLPPHSRALRTAYDSTSFSAGQDSGTRVAACVARLAAVKLIDHSRCLAVDVAFFAANAMKIEHRGWSWLAVAGIVLTLLSTWKKGRALLAAELRAAGLPLELFLAETSTT